MDQLLYTLLGIGIIGVLILIHEAGHFFCAKAFRIPVKEFALGFGTPLLRWRYGETDMRLNLLPLGGYCAFLDDDKAVSPDDPGLMRNRPVWQRFIVVSGGVAANFAFAFVVLVVAGFTIGFAHLKQGEGLYVTHVVAGQPAEKVGLTVGDQILRVEGQAVKEGDAFIKEIRQRSGVPTTLLVKRGATNQTIQVVPSTEGKIGVGISPALREFRREANPITTVSRAATQHADLTVKTVEGLAMFIKGQLSWKEMGGPIEIVRASSHVGQRDLRDLLPFMALISIGLAVMNVLPLPALDGGHMVFLGIEAIRRKPLPQSVERPIQQGGLVVLLGLMMLLLAKDIFRPIDYSALQAPKVQSPSPPPSSP